MNNKKEIAFSEIFLLAISFIAFSFLIGQTFPTVSANSYLPTGCCPESVDGAVCLDMLSSDSAQCATSMIATQCSEVESCQRGCCYDTASGDCTLNAPKSSCVANGGNWSNSPNCIIEQCTLGCCMLGSQSVPSTTRECTNLAAQYGFEKQFMVLDTEGTCQSYANPYVKGACLVDSGDYSGENSCIFGEKVDCLGEFHEGKLCTDLSLLTTCVPTQETTCVETDGRIYYKDSCDNIANIYDASRYDDEEYWTDVVSPSGSCSSPSLDCGNCDYLEGSICSSVNVVDQQPTHGDYICRDLNCDNGAKHGESWCVYDYDVTNSIAPVGTRHFVANCVEGDISLEGCADFNQEICIQTTSESTGNIHARCYPNDWRSCINANGKGDYSLVERECEKLPQCIMFNEYWGEESVKRSDGVFLTGFNPDLLNSQQGAAAEAGEGANEVIPFCIPRYTPGFQFWDSAGSGSSGMGSGGNSQETNNICSIGDFTCIARKTRKCTLLGGCDNWKDNENWECNIDGVSATITSADLPQWLASMNERCRAIGSCGTNIGISGGFGFDEGFSVDRSAIDREGKQEDDIDKSAYVLSGTYLNYIKGSSGLIEAGELSKSDLQDGLNLDFGGSVSEGVDSENGISLADVLTQATAQSYNTDGNLDGVLAVLGGAGGLGGLTASLASGMVASVGAGIGIVAAGAALGYGIGKMIARNQGWSPGRTEAFLSLMTSVGLGLGGGVVLVAESSLVGLTTSTAVEVTLSSGSVITMTAAEAQALGVSVGTTTGSGGITAGAALVAVGWAAIIAALIYLVYAAFFDDFTETEYYVQKFNCEGWEPAVGGDCNSCNVDARPCSEYRCRSIGSNCRYHTALGDPGTCASISDTWQAIIEPWEEVLSEGSSYAEVGDNGFKILGAETDGEVTSWESFVFGVSTDKESICKIDTTHTKDYTSMAYEMLSLNRTHHFITLSQFGEAGTVPMVEGENELYIRCMNFAGEINEAEFAVQFVLSDAPDLTPPVINGFDPENDGYLKYGENSTDLYVYLSEPSECRINNGFDSNFNVMEENMSCVTNPNLGFMGSWPCFTRLTGLVNNQNTFYIKCLDKPGINSTTAQRMLSQTYIYTIDKCHEGLTINSITPTDEELRTNSAGEMTLEVQTTGCINNGESDCYYNFGAGNIPFLHTSSTLHEQVFNSLGDGDYTIDVYCEDSAGNNATAQTNVTVVVDQVAPQIVRVYSDGNTLKIRTNEPARCAIVENRSVGDCDLEIPSSQPLQTLTQFPVAINTKYYIQCEDDFENKNAFCQEVFIN